MAGLRDSLSALEKMRTLFQGRLSNAAVTASKAQTTNTPALREIKPFGSNPGNLRMFAHAPSLTAAKPALVVALHGCTQNALSYARGTGWSDVADRHGFVVVYPEQQAANNPKHCFSWFVPADTSRGCGEALSIRQIIETAVSEFGIDEKRIFITGLSAGGAMASVMLATYPEVFAGGAIIGGLPYGSAENVQQAFDAMFTEQAPSPRALGDRVRAATKHEGPWPRISVWNGTADTIVKPSNADHIVKQWINVQGLAREPSDVEDGSRYSRRVWTNRNGVPQLEAFSVAGMAHGVPLTTVGPDACGTVGPFFLETGVSATSHIIRFWELDGAVGELKMAAYVQSSAAVGANSFYAPNVGRQSAETEQEATTAQTIGSDFNPNRAISAAFKAAGLPPLGEGKAGTTVDPAAIIAAALKAAGLSR